MDSFWSPYGILMIFYMCLVIIGIPINLHHAKSGSKYDSLWDIEAQLQDCAMQVAAASASF